MVPAAASNRLIPGWRAFAFGAKALGASFALLFLAIQPSFGADCAAIAEMLARLQCYNRAADSRLPMPKGATRGKELSREQRVRKFGGQVSGGQTGK